MKQTGVEKTHTLSELYNALSKVFQGIGGPNPYWEKWKRGRPSKAQIETRKKYIEWNQQFIKDHPEEFPMLTTLREFTGNKIVNGKIKYINRG